jgi:hypothetical protein
MQPILRALIILQTITVEVAVLAAMGDIETTECSGPIVGGMGLIVAFLAFRRNLPIGLCFGLAAPTVYVLCFALISGMGWDPDGAERPMRFILTVVALVHVVAALIALEELTAAEGDRRQRLPFQFSIMALLVLMVLVSVFFGSYQSFGHVGAAVGALFVYGVILTYVLRQFVVMRSRQREERASNDSSVARIIDEER